VTKRVRNGVDGDGESRSLLKVRPLMIGRRSKMWVRMGARSKCRKARLG